jgi:hypothetical protein
MVPVALVPGSKSSAAKARWLLPDVVPHADAAVNAGRAALLVEALGGRPDLLMPATEDLPHQSYRAEAMPRSEALMASLRVGGHPGRGQRRGADGARVRRGRVPLRPRLDGNAAAGRGRRGGGLVNGPPLGSLDRQRATFACKADWHVGHADLIRESVDGLVGEDPPRPDGPPG